MVFFFGEAVTRPPLRRPRHARLLEEERRHALGRLSQEAHADPALVALGDRLVAVVQEELRGHDRDARLLAGGGVGVARPVRRVAEPVEAVLLSVLADSRSKRMRA